MNYINLTSQFEDTIMSTKTISKTTLDAKELAQLLMYFDYFNTLTKFETNINGYELAQFKVPTQFKDMIYPSEMNIGDSSYFAMDYLVRPERISSYKEIPYGQNSLKDVSINLTPLEFQDLVLKFLGNFRKSATDLTSLDKIKISRNYVNEMDRVSIQGRCDIGKEPFFPTPVNFTTIQLNRYPDDEITCVRLAFAEKCRWL